MADDTGAQGDDKPKDDASGTNDTNKGDQGASGATGTGEGDKNDAPEGSVSLAEYEALKERMRGADKAKSDAETKLREIERKDQTELQKAQGDLEDAKKANAALADKVNEMALTNAFLTNNKYTWHDPADALALLNREGVEISEDGKVTGLGPAIDKLAKSKKHLLKSETDDTGDGGDSSAASGSATNGRRKGEDKNDKKDYSRRFPALQK